MKVLLQRVSRAQVTVDQETVGTIGVGYLALLGCCVGDTQEDVDRLSLKTATLRVFEDEAGRMNRSLQDVGGSILVVSQFTLYADTKKGNRPSFVQAGDPAVADLLYRRFTANMRTLLSPERVATGRFGASMRVELVNEGPCTIELLSEVAKNPPASNKPLLPMPKLELVPVETEAQVTRVRKIAEETWPHCYGDIISSEQIDYMIEWMYNAEAVRKQTSGGTPFYLVLADGEEAGLVSFDKIPHAETHDCELHKIYVLPQYWSRGIGNWILNQVCEITRQQGAESVWLRVNKNNMRAQKAYRTAGFFQRQAICTDIGNGFVMDDFIFRKRLGG
ncbi:MAG: D-tyrosyl-tRNA(Tyr) deacylase [Kiritimatiellae bacterium]|nr:D-tyrosyl-tRNA(Tyr) deacylase [Kiritimatiellia bacterium]